MNRTASMILGLALAACGGPNEASAPQEAAPPSPIDVAPSAAPTSSETAPAPTITVTPLTLGIDKRKDKQTLDLAANGTVAVKTKGQEGRHDSEARGQRAAR